MKKIITTVAVALMMNVMQAQKFDEQRHSDKNGFSYVTFSNDENGVRVYTLKYCGVSATKCERKGNPNFGRLYSKISQRIECHWVNEYSICIV